MAEEEPSSVSRPGKKIIQTFKRIYHIRHGRTGEEAGEGVGFERARRSRPNVSLFSKSAAEFRGASALNKLVHWLAIAAMVFGAVTLFSGWQALFGSPEARASVGNAVPFVLWFNFCAGFVYILAGLGLLRRRPWAVYASIFLASSTALVAAAFGAYVLGGGAFEVRTVGAMAIRLLFWIVVSVASISAKKAAANLWLKTPR